ncbi:MAG: sel1 repeat family protein, partial [Alphaproteobacteria bacterium]|nr:sel1 repeat family protein [Alphaproteobacteria bacterium]
RLAASFNNVADAQFHLGQLYFYGKGVPHDYGKAIEFYSLAAAQGHGGAQFILGSMYEEGWGVKQDLIKAYAWVKMSLARKDQALAVNRKYDPEKKLPKLMAKMNKFQIGEGEKLIRELGKR